MNTLTPFQFETHTLRVQLDDAGQSWFNANDVCEALELTNPRKALSDHVDSEDVTKRDTLTAGGTQAMSYVNESGLYALILGSTKESAKRFKRWVTSEVLPSIRKTGSYTTTPTLPEPVTPTQDTVSAILLIGAAMAKVPGVKPGILAAATLTCIQENTGLRTETLRKSLPAASEPICTLNATQLGKLINKSAKATNQLLATHGLQFRNDRDEWELTDPGHAWAEALPYSRNGHSSYQILWNPEVTQNFEVAS